MGKEVVLLPASTVTLDVMVATAVLPLASWTTWPPGGAGDWSETTVFVWLPPLTLLGSITSDDGGTGATRGKWDWGDWLFQVAVIVTVLVVGTGFVVMAKLFDWAPSAIVTLAGSEAAGSLLVRVTSAPPAGARPFRTTVPVRVCAPFGCGSNGM